MIFNPESSSRKRGYIPPEACDCSFCLQFLLAVSDDIDPGIEDDWGTV